MSLDPIHTTTTPDGKDISLVDIVAIHGLAEDSDQTWSHTSTGINWLKELLPYAAKGALRPRIFSYSYRADISILLASDAASNILQHAYTLVARLQSERSLTDTSKRPLIFICHGFGGIILKRALALSAAQVSSKVTHNYSIYISTFGILFFGTPHNGMESAALRSLAETQLVTEDVKNVVKNQHEILQDIADQFAPIAKQFHVFFFWEQVRTVFGTESSYAVQQDSAAPHWDNTERSAIYANHSEMCKFEKEDDSQFKTVLSALLRFSRAAERSISHRWQVARRFLATQRAIEASELVGFNVHQNNSPFMYSNTPKTPEWEAEHLRNRYFHVPHSASNIFTGQDRLYHEVEQNLLSTKSCDPAVRKKVYVLHGLGGSGKTQFCLKFVEDHRDHFWAIFWVDASSIETAERALSHIGKVGGLGDNHQAGLYWLTGLDMPWLLVIDNADDASVDYSRFFPSGDKGHILMTSRLRDCKIHATVGHHEFRDMEEDDAVTLLLRAANLDVDIEFFRSVAQTIVKALGCLPLALVQAGASISQRICTIEQYPALYATHRSDLLKRRSIQNRDSYKYSIYTTWEITIRRMEEENTETTRDATELIQIFAFLHFQQVPATIFERAWNNIQEKPDTLPPQHIVSNVLQQCSRVPILLEFLRTFLAAWIDRRSRRLPRMLNGLEGAWDLFRFRDALAVLENYSLIYRDSGKEESYSMHPLVHAWARDRLDIQEQLIYSEVASNTTAASITSESHPNQHLYRISLIPHITACLKRNSARTLLNGMESDYQISKALKFATVYSEGGDWTNASQIQERIIEILLSASDSPDSRILNTMMALADCYFNLDRIPRSLDLLLQAVNKSRSSLGPEDITTLRAMDRLAGTMWLCGQRGKARELSEAAVTGLKKLVSSKHLYLLDAMDNWGRTLMHLGYPHRAAELHKEVLREREVQLGASHPDTLMTMANLGMSYHALKQFYKAEELLGLVFHERCRVLGEDHAYTLWAINDLAKIRCDRGYPIEAEVMLTDILPTVVRTLGEDHIGMSMTKHNLVRAYMMQERWADSKRFLLEIIEVQKKKMPVAHPDRISSSMDLAKVTKQLGELGEAKILSQDAVNLSTAVFGLGDNRTRIALGQLSAICIARGQLEEAEEIDVKIREAVRLKRDASPDPPMIPNRSDNRNKSIGVAPSKKSLTY